MDMNVSPFLTVGYRGKEYFCDREYELKNLKNNVKNGINTTLISMRRLGKSALIYRLFEDFNPEKYACIFVDIYACTNFGSAHETDFLAR